MRFIDLRGERFGKLIVIQYVGKNKHRQSLWSCKCDCGNNTVVTTQELRKGDTKSCGCLQRHKARVAHMTHGLSGTTLYQVWQHIRRRCNDAKDPAYPNYGGRGIYICEEWNNSVLSFVAWANSSGYAEGLTIERIDNDGPYSPDNCTWVTKAQQNINKRATKKAYCADARINIAKLAAKHGLRAGTLQWRLSHGWPLHEACHTPVRTSYVRGK